MTELKGDGTVTRKVQSTDPHGQQLVVTLHAKYLEIRTLGSRRRFMLGYPSVLHAAAQVAADKQRIERKLIAKKKR